MNLKGNVATYFYVGRFEEETRKAADEEAVREAEFILEEERTREVNREILRLKLSPIDNGKTN